MDVADPRRRSRSGWQRRPPLRRRPGHRLGVRLLARAVQARRWRASSRSRGAGERGSTETASVPTPSRLASARLRDPACRGTLRRGRSTTLSPSACAATRAASCIRRATAARAAPAQGLPDCGRAGDGHALSARDDAGARSTRCRCPSYRKTLLRAMAPTACTSPTPAGAGASSRSRRWSRSASDSTDRWVSLATSVGAPYWTPDHRYAINIRDGVDWAPLPARDRSVRHAADMLTPARANHLSVEAPVRVHVLIDTLGVGGAEVLLTEFARIEGVDLSVGCLKDVGSSHVAERLRASGLEPRCVGIPPRLGVAAFRRVRRHLAAGASRHSCTPTSATPTCSAARRRARWVYRPSRPSIRTPRPRRRASASRCA